ncbi:MAG: DUF2207 domain-containing protein [Firmicutes bacterium]|nr:DUF2207 domain-containing protein [Bacillota bacterium]
MLGRKKQAAAIFLFAIIVVLMIISAFATIAVMPVFATVVMADSDREYYISKYNILVYISSDGSASVEEHITYNFSGKFNGVTLNIDLSGTNGIEKPQVFINRKGTEVKAEENNSGARGTYTFNLSNNTAMFKVYEPSQDEEKTFVYRYKLLDAVTRYNDIAEFNRKMIGTGWEVPINNVYIKVTIPEGATKEEINIFGHGPLTGESEIIDAKTAEFKVPAVSPGTFVETRVLFPNKLVPNSKNIVSKDALSDILKYEEKLAEEANIEREKAREFLKQQEERRKRLSLIGNILFGILLPLWFAIIIYIYLKYDREFKHSFFGQYYRELPGEYTPAEMSVLMSMGSVHPRDIMATLMDLVRKRYLLLEKVDVDKKSLFGTKKVSEYMISLNNEKPLTDLKSHESFLINWFINEIGNGHDVLLNDIKDYAKKNKTALDFKGSYDLWCEKAEMEAKKNNFFDNSAKKGQIIGILSAIFYIAAGIALPAAFYTAYGVILLFLGIIMLIFSARIKRRSSYGNEQYAKWKAFRKFLKDFSRLREAEIQSIILWEHYLVYAISLGVAKEVIKQLPLVFKDTDLNNPQLTFLYGMSYGYFSNFERTFNDTIRTVESAVTTATAIANSKNSSLSGKGGGFSGGSSGGGGGGSGGGAF